MRSLRRNKKGVSTAGLTELDYSVLNYEELLAVNGAGGSSGGGSSGGPSESTGHYNRNDNNTDLPSSPEDAEAKGYHKMDENKDIYHEQGYSDDYNTSGNNKYISADGKKEIVFNEKGEVVKDPVNMGTYNYADPEEHPVQHFFKDMLPYWVLGNSSDDPTTFDERVLGTYGGDVNAKREDRDMYHEHH